jgi:hypothetical protein
MKSKHFIVGHTLPDNLTKETKDFFENSTTPESAKDLVKKVKAIESKSLSKAEEFATLTEATIGASHTICRNKKRHKWTITFNQFLIRKPSGGFAGYSIEPYKLEADTLDELFQLAIDWINLTKVGNVVSYVLNGGK